MFLWVQESFDGLSSLKQLMIDRNRVEEIQPGAFSQLGFLNLLSLTHNQLVYIPNMAFQVLTQLTNTKTPQHGKLKRWFKETQNCPTSSPSRACRTSNGFVWVTTLWTTWTLRPSPVCSHSPVSVWTTTSCSSSPLRPWPGRLLGVCQYLCVSGVWVLPQNSHVNLL